MGLDVYLYHSTKSLAEVRVTKDAASKLDNELYDRALRDLNLTDRKYADWTEKDKDAYSKRRKELRVEHKLDDDDQPEGLETKIEIDSKVYPKHMFKIGYLRSSYNEGGINSILRRKLGENRDLYYIFPAEDGDGYLRKVNWGEALKRAREVRDAFSTALAETGPYDVLDFFPNVFGGLNDLLQVDSKEKAMGLFQVQRKRRQEHIAQLEAQGKTLSPVWDRGAYSNREGHYFLGDDCIEVEAVIPGVKRSGFLAAMGKEDPPLPGSYLVVRVKDYKDEETGEMEKPFGYYTKALEIVCEMCEWVLSQPDPENYYFHWSS